MAPRRLLTLLLGLLVSATVRVSVADDNHFEVALDDAGNYKLRVRGETWLASGPTFFSSRGKVLCTHDGTLSMTKRDLVRGADVLGRWESQRLFFSPKGSPAELMIASVKIYVDPPLPLILFGQEFPNGLMNSSTGMPSKVGTSFPSFKIDMTSDLGFLAFGGIMVGDTHKSIGRWGNDTGKITGDLDSGPLVLFNRYDDAIIVSPFTSFMTSSVTYAHDAASWGLLSSLKNIPAGYEYWTSVFYSSQGINKAFRGWGEVIRKYHGKPSSFRESDMTNNYIGYWTDNGAYYYYLTKKKKVPTATLR